MSDALQFACSQCGHRQDAEGDCARCRSDTVHDLRRSNTRDLFGDIELRPRFPYLDSLPPPTT